MIEKLTVEDSEILAQIYNESFSDNWSVETFRKMLSDNLGFGFKFIEDFQICGFILCRIVCDEIEIITFTVRSPYRRKGIGRQLLHELTLYAQQHTAPVFLEVAQDNVAAQSLYLSESYQKISVRKGYYNGTDAIVMKLNSH